MSVIDIGITIPSDPAARKKILGAMQEISNSLTRAEAEKDLIRDIVNDLSKEYELPKKILNKMARTYHKRNFSEEVATNDAFETLYEKITNETSI